MFGLTNRRPSAKDAAIRAYVMKAVIVSALALPPLDPLHGIASAWTPADRDGFFRDLTVHRRAQWESLGRWASRISPRERRFANTAPQDVTPQQHTDTLWRLEAFQTLVWALGQLEFLPGYDEQASEALLTPFPPTGQIETFLKQARLRPKVEIDRQRELAELWHWRSRTRHLLETGTPISPGLGFATYDDIVRSVAGQEAVNSVIGPVTDEDFTAFGRAYRDLDADQWTIVGSIARERHFALNWLCGYAPHKRWDDTPTDT
jgi:hypothetical protein